MGIFKNLINSYIYWSTKDLQDDISSMAKDVISVTTDNGIRLFRFLSDKYEEYEKKKLEIFNKKIVEKKYVDAFIELDENKYPIGSVKILMEKLENLTNEQFAKVIKGRYRSPIIMFVVSLLFGLFGIDRFLIGEIWMGLLKLFTLGCCGILWIVDLFSICQRTKDYNLKRFNHLVLKYNKHNTKR